MGRNKISHNLTSAELARREYFVSVTGSRNRQYAEMPHKRAPKSFHYIDVWIWET